MITGLLVLEDTVLKFTIPGSTEECRLTVSDSITGHSRDVVCNNEQLGAIIGTAICGTNEAVMAATTPLIRQVIPVDWPSELQPCPV